jgi:DNA-binding CsgD family transcriptional regulator
MDAGLRINGDPIVYLGIPEEWQLRALQPDRFEREAEEGDQLRNTLVDQLLRKAVIEADLTPLQAWVLVLTAFGVQQKQIASTLNATPFAVIRAMKSATKKIGLRVLEA